MCGRGEATAVSMVCGEVRRGVRFFLFFFLAWAMCTDGVLISAADCTLHPFRLPRIMSAVWYKLFKIQQQEVLLEQLSHLFQTAIRNLCKLGHFENTCSWTYSRVSGCACSFDLILPGYPAWYSWYPAWYSWYPAWYSWCPAWYSWYPAWYSWYPAWYSWYPAWYSWCPAWYSWCPAWYSSWLSGMLAILGFVRVQQPSLPHLNRYMVRLMGGKVLPHQRPHTQPHTWRHPYLTDLFFSSSRSCSRT